MGFVFDGRNRLEKLASTVLGLKIPKLANLGQVDRSPGEDDQGGSYAYEDQNGFEYLIKLGATTAK